MTQQDADVRNDYEEGFRHGLKRAAEIAYRISYTLENEYRTGAQETAKAIEQVLANAK